MQVRPIFWWLLGGAALAWIATEGVDIVTNATRGIRNNNPGNIRLSSTVWAGQVPAGEQTDKEFVQFTDPVYGIRAMAKIFKNYFARGVVTLAQVAATWAPPSENDTQAYIESLKKQTGFDPNSRLSPADLPAVIPAFIHQENGAMPYTQAQILKGISLA